MFLKTEKGAIVAQFVYNPILYYNGKYIIGDISSDTVYAHVPDGGLKPVLARTPLVHDMEEKVLLYPSLKAGRYFFFSTTTCEFDFKTKKGFPTTDLVYDYATDKTFKSHLVNIDFPTQELNLNDSGKTQVKCPNTVCQLIPCDKLLEALTEGKLKGRLKEIASTLKEDDNPVLMLLRTWQSGISP